MYTVIYLYRVKKEHVQGFLDINTRAGEIYMSYGCLEETIYQAENLHGDNNFKGLIDVIQKEENEDIFLGQSVFRNKSHYDEVMEQVKANPEVSQLFDELSDTIDLSNVITARFSTDN
ncbi:DUF1428 family protein [Lentibacillus sp. CBA3610]|uniref:DUF1428 family protein n=1 Tax=Lentibacillus sp. CBA3610 TaxID=2518176 RepID=UPI0015953CC9|nr:DUF1428 family protein [Lentibacillus sp. CBA3610]QKY71529.1 DUF1428 family protein [Lentibacillus sp. CBA3610]